VRFSPGKEARGKQSIYPVGLGRGPNAYLLRSLPNLWGAAELFNPRPVGAVMVRLLEGVAFSLKAPDY
jgi:hypothetical protein